MNKIILIFSYLTFAVLFAVASFFLEGKFEVMKQISSEGSDVAYAGMGFFLFILFSSFTVFFLFQAIRLLLSSWKLEYSEGKKRALVYFIGACPFLLSSLFGVYVLVKAGGGYSIAHFTGFVILFFAIPPACTFLVFSAVNYKKGRLIRSDYSNFWTPGRVMFCSFLMWLFGGQYVLAFISKFI